MKFTIETKDCPKVYIGFTLFVETESRTLHIMVCPKLWLTVSY